MEDNSGRRETFARFCNKNHDQFTKRERGSFATCHGFAFNFCRSFAVTRCPAAFET
ncbi:hypothetical protein [Paracoccus sp. R86501]|uniref:hypothetical protein n=1 Tax=Paracoccus sp. R86501 TaxID=3101711 RepID=UPI00366F058C